MAKKVGRPTKYNPKYHLAWATSLAMEGLTQEEIAERMEIAYSTFKKWKKENPEFSAAVQKGKDASDAEVELSLFKRACGYTAKEKKVIVAMDADGNQKPARIETSEREVPPDVTAIIWWLKNRKRDAWRDKWDIAIESEKDFVFNIIGASQITKEEEDEE